jgi:hypothetical protein
VSDDLITRLRTVMIDIDPKYVNQLLFDPGKGTFAS